MSLSNKYGIEEEKIKQLIRDGWIGCTVAKYECVIATFDKYKSSGMSSIDAVTHTADESKLSERHVWRIIKKYN